MKKLFLALALLAAPLAATAATNDNFVGPRVAVSAGISDITAARNVRDVTYGASLGLDAPVGDRVVVGVEAYTDNLFAKDRAFGVAGRVGYAVTANVMPYVRAGYENYRAIDFSNRASTLDGFTVGGGLEVAMTRNLYSGVEYRYSDFNRGVGRHSALIKLGLRL